jgi:hypothetical protein
LVFAHHDQQLAVAAALRADEVLHDATVRQTHRGEPATGHEIPVVAVTDVDAVWFVAAHDSRVVERLRAFASLDIEGHLVDTIERWPAPSGHDRSSRRLAFVTRLATIDRATFRERWSVHAALVRAHQPSIAAYTQHLIVDSWGPVPRPFDGIAEFAYVTHPDGTTPPRYDSDEGRDALAADIAGLLAPGGSRSVWVRGT